VALARDGLPFRKAHGVVAGLVAEARKTGVALKETARRLLAKEHPRLAADADALFYPEKVVRTRSLPGGTAPDAVRESLRLALETVGAKG